MINKRAQGISINVIIIAAIALLVLVIILPVLNTFRKAAAAAKEDKTDHVSPGPLLRPAENPITD